MKYIVSIFFTLIINCNIISQTLTLKDSVKVAGNIQHDYRSIGQIQIIDTLIYFLYSDSGKVIIYSLKGEKIDQISLEGKWKKGVSYSSVAQGYIPENEGDFLIFNSNGDHFFYFDKNGKKNKRFRYVKAKFHKVPYTLLPSTAYTFDPFETIYFDKNQKKIFMPIIPAWDIYDRKGDYKISALENIYNTEGLIGVFTYEGKLINVIGKFDEVYRKNKFLIYLNSIYSYYDPKTQTIFIGQEGSEQISTYDLSGKHLKTFGVGNSTDYLPTISSKEEFQTIVYHNKLITNNYKYLFYDNKNNLTYRIYAKAIEDNTEPEKGYDKLAVLLEMKKNKIPGCPRPSKQEMQQKELLEKKPHYLQIYDNTKNNVLIAEIQVQYPFKILKAEQNFIWVHSGFDYEKNQHIILKYEFSFKNK